MIVISDTTTITNLIHVNKLELLKKLYEEIIIPTEVYNELLKLPNQKTILMNQDWIKKENITDINLYEKLAENLDKGEAEAITIAIEKKSDLLIIDELAGRNIAKSYGLKIIGLLGVLIESKQKELILELKPILDNLIDNYGFRIHPNLYKKVISEVGE